jgi:hypothetical protein
MIRKQWAKEFFAVVDSRQPAKIAEYMTDDVRLQVELPCTSTLRLKGDKVADYRIFIEPSPAFVD